MSAGRILLFGATGFTGRITAQHLVRAGCAPVLLGRSKSALQELADDLDDLAPGGRQPTIAIADATDPASLAAVLSGPRDVLVSTVGPFTRRGDAALSAAVDAGAGYLDASDEPAFIRRAFDECADRAATTGARILPAFGYAFVAGNLAAALLARRRQSPPSRIDVGYFIQGPHAPSSGSLASVGSILMQPSHALRHGAVVTERTGAHVRSFGISDQHFRALSIGGSEAFAVPPVVPGVRDVNVYVGWAGRWSRAAATASLVAGGAHAIPGLGSALDGIVRATVGGASDNGPAEHRRTASRSVIVCEGFSPSGRLTDQVVLEGLNPYDLTASLLAWGAQMLAGGHVRQQGVLGPVAAFGLDPLVAGCLALGLSEAPDLAAVPAQHEP